MYILCMIHSHLHMYIHAATHMCSNGFKIEDEGAVRLRNEEGRWMTELCCATYHSMYMYDGFILNYEFCVLVHTYSIQRYNNSHH